LQVSLTGDSGIDGTTLERKTNSSQAATSRNLKLLSVQLGLVEFFLDQADGRRRLARCLPKGEQLINRMLSAIRP
jgi:DNA-binding MarR family transcriptional regulator